MAMAALSPNSVLSTSIQVNPQTRTDQQTSVPQVAQDARKTGETVRTDTITISPQALKMADDKNIVAKEAADKDDEQKALQAASDKADAVKSEAQRNAVKAYATVSAIQ